MNVVAENQSPAGTELEEQLEELRAFWANINSSTLSHWIFQVRRWRQETLNIIINHLGTFEGEQFDKVSSAIASDNSDTPDSLALIIQRVDAYLVALLESIWSERIVIQSPVISKIETFPASTASELTLPEKVTASWLFTHVPLKYWTTLCCAFIFAFTAGLKFGQTDTGRDILRGIGLSVFALSENSKHLDNIKVASTKHSVRSGNISGRDYIKVRPKEILTGIQSFATTTRDANDYQQKYFSDKWIHIDGPIHDITGMSDLASVVLDVDGISTSFLLRDNQISKLDRYQVGDNITIEGLFAHASKENGVDFMEAEIIE